MHQVGNLMRKSRKPQLNFKDMNSHTYQLIKRTNMKTKAF